MERYQTNVDRCAAAKSSFRGEELTLYINYLSNVQKSYSDLLMSSKKRHSDLETLMDFVQSATNELIWLSEKEEREITRDWSSKNLNLVEVEQYYEVNYILFTPHSSVTSASFISAQCTLYYNAIIHYSCVSIHI